MRFKIESERVLNYLKGRGFKVCDIKRTGKPTPIVEAPKKWAGVSVEVHEGSKKFFVDKTRAIVQRVMDDPTIGVAKHDPMPAIFLALQSADQTSSESESELGRIKYEFLGPPNEPDKQTERAGWLDLTQDFGLFKVSQLR